MRHGGSAGLRSVQAQSRPRGPRGAQEGPGSRARLRRRGTVARGSPSVEAARREGGVLTQAREQVVAQARISNGEDHEELLHENGLSRDGLMRVELLDRVAARVAARVRARAQWRLGLGWARSGKVKGQNSVTVRVRVGAGLGHLLVCVRCELPREDGVVLMQLARQAADSCRLAQDKRPGCVMRASRQRDAHLGTAEGEVARSGREVRRWVG